MTKSTVRRGVNVTIFHCILLATILIACTVQSSAAEPLFKLAESGRTKVSIVISGDAPVAEQTAAKELSRYLQQITGAKFDIYSPANTPSGMPRILIGQSQETQKLLGNIDWKTLKYDGIVIKFVGNDLVLAGDRPRGSLYAVYTFLEDYLGCRWWTTEDSYIPAMPDLSVKRIDKTHIPPFMYRETYFAQVKNKNLEFASRLKLNGTHHPVPKEYGGYYNLLGFVHTFDTFLPAKDYFTAHPEWFSLVNGNRVGGQVEGQLCLTNQEMKNEFVKQTLKQIEQDVSAGMISVSQNDNSSFCQCENCTSVANKYGGQSGLLVHFVNSVADEIAKVYPDFLVETLAYHYTRHAPRNIKPRDNVIIRLCTAECDFATPMDSRNNTEFYKDIKGWKSISKRLYVWDYIANFVNLTLGHPNWNTLAPNIRIFAANNVIGLFEQGDGFNSDPAFGKMKMWVISHLMWDPTLDSRKLIKQFADGYYGAASPYVIKYLDLVCKAIEKSGIRLTYVFGSNLEYMKQKEMDTANGLFDKAEQAVSNDPVMLKRVQVARLSLDHMWLLQPQLDKTNAGKARGLDIKEVAERYIKLSESSGNNYIGEGGLMTEAYYASLRNYAALPYVPASKRQVTPPIATKGLKPDEWADIQDSKITLYMPGVLSLIVGDKDASDQRAVRMPGNQLDWATQAFLDRSGLKPGTKVDVYVTVKAALKSNSGLAFSTGIYDDKNQKRILDSKIMIQDIPDSKYHEYKLGTYTLEPGWYVYVAPPGDAKLVEEILVDRVFLIIHK